MSLYGGFSLALPEILLSVSALVLLLVGVTTGPRGSTAVSVLSITALVAAAALAAGSPTGTAFAGGFVSDSAAAFAKVAIYLASAVAVALGAGWLARLNSRQFEYPVLILLAAVGMGMMASSGDL